MAYSEIEHITESQRPILVGIARGLTNRQIAAELFLAVDTVKCHIANMMMQTEAKNRAHLASYACLGFLPDEETTFDIKSFNAYSKACVQRRLLKQAEEVASKRWERGGRYATVI